MGCALLIAVCLACGAPPAAPHDRIGHVSVAIGGKLYLLGGLSSDGRAPPSRAGAIYDPRSGLWSETAPMPTPRVFAAGAVSDGVAFVVGGLVEGSRTYVRDVEAYDAQRDAWETLAPLPIGRSRMAAAACDGRVFIVGGLEGSDDGCANSARLDIYDVRLRSWTHAADMPTARHACAAAAVGGRLYVLGGYVDAPGNTMKPCAVVESFKPGGGAWRREPDMLSVRNWFAAVEHASGIVAIGSDGAAAAPERLDLSGEASQATQPAGAGPSWRALRCRDAAGRRFAASVIGDAVYVTGGEGGGNAFLRVLDLKREQWSN